MFISILLAGEHISNTAPDFAALYPGYKG